MIPPTQDQVICLFARLLDNHDRTDNPRSGTPVIVDSTSGIHQKLFTVALFLLRNPPLINKNKRDTWHMPMQHGNPQPQYFLESHRTSTTIFHVMEGWHHHIDVCSSSHRLHGFTGETPTNILLLGFSCHGQHIWKSSTNDICVWLCITLVHV